MSATGPEPASGGAGRGAVPEHAFVVLDLVERTDAWWAWRRGGIGSSDAATILGEDPRKSVERLLRERREPALAAVRAFSRARGAAVERAARAAYAAAVGVSVAPACVQNRERPWQRASLDGLAADGIRAVEIKCGRATYQSVAARGRPPQHHFAQLQHILAVTGLGAVDYWCFVPGWTPLRLEVRRDDAYVARLIAAEAEFWARVGVAGAG